MRTLLLLCALLGAACGRRAAVAVDPTPPDLRSPDARPTDAGPMRPAADAASAADRAPPSPCDTLRAEPADVLTIRGIGFWATREAPLETVLYDADAQRELLRSTLTEHVTDREQVPEGSYSYVNGAFTLSVDADVPWGRALVLALHVPQWGPCASDPVWWIPLDGLAAPATVTLRAECYADAPEACFLFPP